jgi:hypothetical protein
MVHVTEKASAIAAIAGPRGSGYNIASKAAPSKDTPEDVADQKANQDKSELDELNVKKCSTCWVKYAGGVAIILLLMLVFTGKIKF